MSSDSDDLGYEDFIWGLWESKLWQCEPLYNNILNNTSEFDKWGSSNASTIMALLPSLVAFAPVVTANIGFLSHLSPTQGFIAAGFTFGLPVRQLDTWQRVSVKVKDLLVDSQSTYGSATIIPRLRPFTEIVDILLAPIKDTVLDPKHPRPRCIWVLSLRFFFHLLQTVLTWLLLVYVPAIDSFYLIWLCPNWGGIVFGIWLGATFTFVGWIRAEFERGSFEGDEILYISKLNTTQRANTYKRRLLEPHPMIVILRPSERLRKNHPHTRYFIGMLQLFWICFLSFLFSGTIGGTLFRSLVMVVVFIVTVGVSRGVSILVCWLALKYLDIKIIEYDNLEERSMMQRLLGGLTGVLIDIRWINSKKTQWQNSIAMYQRGHQLSGGKVIRAPNDTKDTQRCPLHPQPRRRDAIVNDAMSLAIGAFTTWASLVVPGWVGYNDPGPRANPTVPRVAEIILIVASTLSCLNLGRGKQLLICKCD